MDQLTQTNQNIIEKMRLLIDLTRGVLQKNKLDMSPSKHVSADIQTVQIELNKQYGILTKLNQQKHGMQQVLDQNQKEHERCQQLQNELSKWENERDQLVDEYERTIKRVEDREEVIHDDTNGQAKQIYTLRQKINAVKELSKDIERQVKEKDSFSKREYADFNRVKSENKKFKQEYQKLKSMNPNKSFVQNMIEAQSKKNGKGNKK